MPQGLESFTISGGEPFLHPDFFPLLEFLQRKILRVSVYTCGVVANDAGDFVSISEWQFARIKKLGVAKIIFSLHGANSTTQEQISGVKGSFLLVMESMRRALRQGLNVELHCVPMKLNYKEIPEIVAVAHQIGIRKLSLLRLVVQGRCSPDLLLSEYEKSEFLCLVDQLKKIYTDMNIRLGAPFNCLTFSGKECTAAKDKLLISANGDIFPCEAFKYQRGQCPNLYNQQNILEVWENDELFQKIRLLSRDNIEYCNSCDMFPQCHGGCSGQRMQAYGDLYRGPDPNCVRWKNMRSQTL